MKCKDWHKAECCDVLFSNLVRDRNDLQPAEAEKTAFRTAFSKLLLVGLFSLKIKFENLSFIKHLFVKLKLDTTTVSRVASYDFISLRLVKFL